MVSETATTSTSFKARLIADFIVATRKDQLKSPRTGAGVPPLMVAFQGPQGAGKTTLTNALQDVLAAPLYNLRSAVVSLDDFYLPHQELCRVARTNPDNALLQGRGLPGTHDLSLLKDVLESVCHLNDPVLGPSRQARLPIFDKSLFAGAGDRSDQTVDVEGPLDVFVLEGWSMGFMPLPKEELREFYSGLPSAESSVYHQHPLQTLEQINENLRDFAASIYPLFDCQINIRPTSYRYVYDWRLQQEHHMKQRTGGKGMSDDEVERFVDRYMPGYELYAGGVDGVGIQASNGKPTLTLTYGKEREVLRVDVV